jgi:hypothetical protein
VHDEGTKSVPHFNEAAIAAPAGNGANGSGNGHGNGDAPHAVTDGSPSAVAAPASPALQSDPETWAPPPWPPPNPATGTPEGPAAR